MSEQGASARGLSWTVFLMAFVISCNNPRCNRADPSDASIDASDQFGGTGTTHNVQCSGWFPDWIARQVPTGRSFQLSQGYPLGVPRIEEVDGKLKIVGWNPYPPASTTIEAPWLAHNFLVASERPAYLESLKQYLLEGNTGATNVEDDFLVQNNKVRSWFHIPMMTTSPTKRREPYHGLTRERALRDDEHKWITNDGFGLGAFAIGAYNWLGGYTIGKVFDDPNPLNAKPAAAGFIPGTFVFKLLFVEYSPKDIVTTIDPLVGSPEWTIQDNQSATGATLKVRLLQVDVAVRDTRATKTGWVFATFVYDKTMTAPTPWAKLRPVGLQWGSDAGDTTSAAIDETWISPGVSADLQREDSLPFGKLGRLNGPVDNPVSSCISCHSTAQYVIGTTDVNAARGVSLVPPMSCSSNESMFWFHDVPAGTPFGVMNTCVPAPPVATPPLYSLDYSLQLADALESSIARRNPNPCMSFAESLKDAVIVDAPPGDRTATDTTRKRLAADRLRDVRANGPLPTEVLRKRAPSAVRLEVKVEDLKLQQREDDLHRR